MAAMMLMLAVIVIIAAILGRYTFDFPTVSPRLFKAAPLFHSLAVFE